MVRATLLAALALLAAALRAQEQNPWAGRGTVRAALTFSTGHLVRQRGFDSSYLSGRLEAFVEDRVSLRGEGFRYTGSAWGERLFDENTLLTAGAFWNWHLGRLNPALGLGPGLALTRAALSGGALRPAPVAQACAGLTYTVWDHFHVFADARYLRAGLQGPGGPYDISEFIWGAGLGLHIR